MRNQKYISGIKYVVLAMCASLFGVFLGCKDEPESFKHTTYVASQVMSVTAEQGVKLRTVLRSYAPYAHAVAYTDMLKVEIEYGKDASFAGAERICIAEPPTSDTLFCNLKADAETTYYYRYILMGETSVHITDARKFTISKGFLLANEWVEHGELPMKERVDAFAFRLGAYGYYGGGFDKVGKHYNDFWRYDPETSTWERMADLPHLDEGLGGASYFVINGEGYVTLGRGKDHNNVNTYKYSPVTGKWSTVAKFPGDGRTGAAAFEMDGKAYVVGGKCERNEGEGGVYTDEVWCYDPVSDSWTAEASMGHDGLSGMFAFVCGGKAYVGGGMYAQNKYNDVCYAFNSATRKFSPMSGVRLTSAYSVALSGDMDAYVIGGYTNSAANGTDDKFFCFTPSAGNFENMGYVGDDNRLKSAGFRIGGTLYLVSGANNTTKEYQTTLLTYVIK